MRTLFFYTAFICLCAGGISCQKEPKKGEYKGTFNGKYVTDSTSFNYETVYYFEIVQSTPKELKLREKESQITSTLKKHEKDSISGVIGFGNSYISSEISSNKLRLNAISIYGKYDKTSITGSFLAAFSDGTKDYPSEGGFVISSH